jgi:hypothetical protein
VKTTEKRDIKSAIVGTYEVSEMVATESLDVTIFFMTFFVS